MPRARRRREAGRPARGRAQRGRRSGRPLAHGRARERPRRGRGRLPGRRHRARVARRRELIDVGTGAPRRDLRPRPPRRPSSATAAVTASIAADLASAAGLERPGARAHLARRGSRRRARPDGRRPATRSTWPAAASRTSRASSACRRLLLESGEVDAALLTGYFGGYAEYGAELRGPRDGRRARRWRRAASGHAAGRSSRRPCTPHGPAAAALREGGVPVYGDIAAAVAALARWLVARASRRRPACPAPAPAAARRLPGEGYFEARELPRSRRHRRSPRPAGSRRSTRRSRPRRELGYPVVLKALGLAAQVGRRWRRPRHLRRGGARAACCPIWQHDSRRQSTPSSGRHRSRTASS